MAADEQNNEYTTDDVVFTVSLVPSEKLTALGVTTVKVESTYTVGWCELDPSLKATCFQPLNLRFHTVLST